MRVLAPVLSLFLFACGGGATETCDNSVDDDGDGFTDCADQDCFASCGEQCGNNLDDDGDGQVDCADSDCTSTCNAAGSPEICDNGLDDDLDFVTDCDDDDCRAICDADADGWVSTSMDGPDCDDTDPAVHPEAEEVPYNGVDDDCDPATSDTDVDGDGFDVDSDCDDTSEATYPGAPETCGDGVVNDCDATTDPTRDVCFGDRPVATADGTLLGTANDDWTGYAVAAAGDVNLDGHGDLLIGAYGEGSDQTGAAYLMMGPITGQVDMSTAQVKWTGESEDDWAGFSLAAGGDLTGNGIPDVLIGARYDDATGHNAGAVYVARVDAAGTVALSDTVAKLFAETEYDSAGYSLAGVGDVDGDLQDDVLVGAPLNSVNGLDAGAAYVMFGPIVGPLQLALAPYKIYGEAQADNAGCSVGAAGDLSGDGNRDILVGACLSDRSGVNAGAAFQFSTHTLGDRYLGMADGAMVGEAPNDQLGFAVNGAGDVNDDGLDDLLVGAPLHDVAGEDAGAAYLAYGPATVGHEQPGRQAHRRGRRRQRPAPAWPA